MVDYRLIDNIQNLRNEGASWAAISRQIINPQTRRHYDYRTVRNWVERGQEPYQHSQKKLVQRTATIRRNVQSDKPTKRTRQFRKKLKLKPKKKRRPVVEIIEEYVDDFFPDYYEEEPEIQEQNLMPFARGKIGRFESIISNEYQIQKPVFKGHTYAGKKEYNTLPDYMDIPKERIDYGHIFLRYKVTYFWQHDPVKGGPNTWDEIQDDYTTNNHQIAASAVAEMQLKLNRLWGTFNGHENEAGSIRPRVEMLEISPFYEGVNRDGEPLFGTGEFVYKGGGYNE